MVEVVYWAPPRRTFRSRLRRPRRGAQAVRNFGDELSPLVVRAMLQRRSLAGDAGEQQQRLLAIGSILHLARDGDVIWGSGVNGKVPYRKFQWTHLDVRAVRGPLTAQVLRERGVEVPDVYGDPGLLLPALFPELRSEPAAKARHLLIAPNLNDRGRLDAGDPRVLDVTMPVRHCVQRIAESEFVVGSALHAIIVAESLGIPARAMSSPVEAPFKYRDYYAATGRPEVEIAGSLEDAVKMGGAPPLSWSPDRLMEAFPYDLWQR